MTELIKLMTAGGANNMSDENLEKWSAVVVRKLLSPEKGRVAKINDNFLGVVRVVPDSGEFYAVCRPAYVIKAEGAVS